MEKSKRITIRLSEEEYYELLRKAAEAELRVSSLIRAAIDRTKSIRAIKRVSRFRYYVS